MKRLYIIGGCNGAGKTTASYTALPAILQCKEFVNADEIAKGLSPFQPEQVALQAGRLMLSRIKELLIHGKDFAFETTLPTRSYANTVQQAQEAGYFVTLLFFWLNSPSIAIKRVATRVLEGGHNIPETVIERRYKKGLINLFQLYIPIVDNWLFIDNSDIPYRIIAQGTKGKVDIKEQHTWNTLWDKYHGIL